MICGDFNFQFISWPEGGFLGRRSSTDREKMQADELLDFMEDNNLANLSVTPTRGNNILDLMLTNLNGSLCYEKTYVSKQLSDHNFMVFNYNQKNIKCKVTSKINLYENEIFMYDIS